MFILMIILSFKVLMFNGQPDIAIGKTISTLNCDAITNNCYRPLFFNNYDPITIQDFFEFSWILLDLNQWFEIERIIVDYSKAFDIGSYKGTGKSYPEVFYLTVPTVFSFNEPLPYAGENLIVSSSSDTEFNYTKINIDEALYVRYVGIYSIAGGAIPLNFGSFHVFPRTCNMPGTPGYCNEQDQCLYTIQRDVHNLICICNNDKTPDGDMREVKCQDEDECKGETFCSQLKNTVCINTLNSFFCHCEFGYHSPTNNGYNCADSGVKSVSLKKKVFSSGPSTSYNKNYHVVDGIIDSCFSITSDKQNELSYIYIDMIDFFQINEVKIYTGLDLKTEMFNIMSVTLVNEFDTKDGKLKFLQYSSCEKLIHYNNETILGECGRINPPAKYIFFTKFLSPIEIFQICEVEVLPYICLAETGVNYCPKKGEYCVDVSNGTYVEKKCVCNIQTDIQKGQNHALFSFCDSEKDQIEEIYFDKAVQHDVSKFLVILLISFYFSFKLL